MNVFNKCKYLILVLGIFAISKAGCTPQRHERHLTSMKPGSEKKVCVGRFLIELPAGFEFSYGQTVMSGVHLTSDDTESLKDFESRTLERKNELSTKKSFGNVTSLERTRNIELHHATGKIFQFGRERSYHFEHGKRIDIEWFSIEAHIRINEISYRFFVEFGDDEQVLTVEQIIANVRHRKPDEVPGQEGFCFENGIVLDTPALPEKLESTVLFAGDRRYPDVAFALSSMSGVNQQRTLLQRVADSPTRVQYRSRFQTIFEGRRSINGIPGEEESHAVRELKGTRGHTFMWESDSVKDDVLKPFLSLELSTGIGRPGKPVNSSLSDKEVKTLWEKISNSLRIRRVSPPMPQDTPIPQPPSSAFAGTPCPRSGLWSCAEHADGFDVVGGSTQYFAEGVAMPEAELLDPKKLFDRRKAFRFASSTSWKFIKERA